LGREGYGDEGGAGHISVRDPIMTDHFWMNPFFKSFKHMRVSDLVLVNEKGDVCEGGNMHAINKAGFMIHSEIHKARPDVVAACHAHSIAGKAFSSLGIELDISTQDTCAFWRDHTVYKYPFQAHLSNGLEAEALS
jgi:ribulose-5-phosphate 4-epimerase/fuculose-1-phosphate aldolase